MTVFVAFLAAVLVVELAATFRVMWLADHGRHRLRAVRLHAPTALPKRWS